MSDNNTITTDEELRAYLEPRVAQLNMALAANSAAAVAAVLAGMRLDGHADAARRIEQHLLEAGLPLLVDSLVGRSR